MKKLFVLVLAMLMAAMLVSPTVFAAADNGMTFSQETLHPLAKNLDKVPLTIEARVQIPADATIKSNFVLIGNNIDGGLDTKTDMLRLQFMKGYIRLCVVDTELTMDKYIYFAIAPTELIGKTFHIAVVTDIANNKALAYLTIEGETTTTCYEGNVGNASKPLDEEPNLSTYGFLSAPAKRPFYIGGDTQGKNKTYFGYNISEIALYSDVRTAEEIEADAREIKKDDNMLVWFQFSEGMTTAEDLSGNGNHMGMQNGIDGTPTFGNYATPETTTAAPETTTAAPETTTAAPETTKAPDETPKTFDSGLSLTFIAAVAGMLASTIALKKKR